MARGGKKKNEVFVTRRSGLRALLLPGMSKGFYDLKRKELEEHVSNMHRLTRDAIDLIKLILIKIMDTTVPLDYFVGRYCNRR